MRRLIICNYIIFLLSIAFSLLILRDILRLADKTSILLKKDVSLRETWVTSTIIWGLTCIGAPIVSLLIMKRNRIHCTNHSPRFCSLFKLHFSHRWLNGRTASRLINHIDEALSYEEGTPIQWSDVHFLTESDKSFVKRLVEDFVYIEQTEDGSIKFIEKSAWLTVLSALVLSSLFFLAALWASAEVVAEVEVGNSISSFSLGKRLSEWVSNFVLTIFGLGQIITRGLIFSAFQGVYLGLLASMTPLQRESMVALYIAISEERIEGLMHKGCYASLQMKGRRWQAPRVNSALLALVEKFDLFQNEGKWVIAWNPETTENGFTVRTVSYSSV